MVFPGPSVLGRGIVLRSDEPVPPELEGAPTVTLDGGALERADELADRLHLHWLQRTPVVIRWFVADDALDLEEAHHDPVWRLDAGFLFPLERLRVLCFSNNYDARSGPPRWWWTDKARRIGVARRGDADGVLPDGTPVWIDGGPRGPLSALDHPVIHGETVEAGLALPVPEPRAAPADGLAADQQAAATEPVGPNRIVAPAGSGKTRTLAARVEHLVDHHRIEPGYLTAVAYNTRAADELRDRLAASNPALGTRSLVRTIHSLGWEVLRDAHPGIELLDEGDVRRLLDGILDTPKRYATDTLGPYLEAMQRVRSGLVDPFRVEEERDDVPGFAAAFETVRSAMYRRNAVDHGEQVYGAIEALVRDPKLRGRWQRRCRHLLVDEFQDLTPAYLLLIRLIASPQLDVFGVGDDDQVIYGYDGADPGFLIDFGRYFPGAAEHALETNYRCPPDVVDAARNLLSYNRRRITKRIRAGRAEAGKGLSVSKTDGAGLALDAAERIATWLAAGIAPTDIAVLTRVNAALIPVKAALVERGIPTDDLVGSHLLDRTTLRAMFAWLRIALDPERIAVRDAREAIRRPHRKLNRVAIELITRRTSLDDLRRLGARLEAQPAERWTGFCDDAEALANAAAAGTSAEVVGRLIHHIGLDSAARQLDSGRRDASRPSHHDDLVAVERASALHPGVDDFANWLRTVLAHPSDPSGVILSTVHRVKGMEWPRVVIFGADRGAMPHDLSDDIEEERRIFHVALTRGIDAVEVLADGARPSRFLGELSRLAPPVLMSVPASPQERPRRPAELPTLGAVVDIRGGYNGTVVAVESGTVTVALDGGTELEVPVDDVAMRSQPAPAAPAAAGLVAELKAWRRETARRLSAPAYVVLHDTTIDEIARRRPGSLQELIDVPGIGSRKLEDYGDDILEIVERHASA